MDEKIPAPTPPSMPDADMNTKISNSPTPPSLNDAATESDTPPLPNENNIIKKTPAPPSMDNDTVQVDEAQNEIESGLGNGFSAVNSNSNSNKSKSLNKIIFSIVGGLVVLAIVGAGAFFMYQGNDDISVSEEIDDEEGFLSKFTNSDKDTSSSSALGGGASCQDEYDKLLSVNEFDFDTYCINQDIRTGDYDANAVPQKKKNLVLIFDASGSMAAQIDGKRKIDIAKEAAWKFIDQVDNEDNFALSIVVYGHKGGNAQSQKSMSCAGIDEIYHLGNVDAEIAKSKLNKFDATGWTPIAGSFQKAKEILSDKPNDENFILLVSDGKEMCDGDPVATIAAIKSEGLNVKADVIGFDVGGTDEAQLKAIAEAGDGDYFSVSNAVDLENAFAKHKELLNEADFKIGRTLEQLSDVSFVINNYNQCLVMLKKEEAVMMLDIHARKLLGESCEQSAQKEYENRVSNIKQQIDKVYESDMKAFNLAK
ncbi:MAG TPA: VWA domain-containing protein [Candidatus Pacebacteria bacterium]|nr:VWA domain-containing protein [Candidatus Paceibacterota bacterium]